jgi:NTP pyrophosphatase (non-canonical NTP hydrolase)
MDDVVKLQKDFDKRHGLDRLHSQEDRDRNIEYLVIAMLGELGDIANQLKKAMRESRMLGKKIPDEAYENIKEEVIDLFIYLLKLSFLLGVDLKKEHMKKIMKNEDRFKIYRKMV